MATQYYTNPKPVQLIPPSEEFWGLDKCPGIGLADALITTEIKHTKVCTLESLSGTRCQTCEE